MENALHLPTVTVSWKGGKNSVSDDVRLEARKLTEEAAACTQTLEGKLTLVFSVCP